MGRTGYDYTSSLILSKSLATTIYIPLLMLFLHSSKQLLNVGHYSCAYVPVLLVLFEIIKKRYYTHSNAVLKKTSLRQYLQAFVLSLVIFYVIPMMFGAPLYDDFEATIMFSLLMTSLTTVPALVHLSYADCLLVFSTLTNFKDNVTEKDAHSRNFQFALIGAWVNAIWIPLDWAADWQLWPVPCIIGALVGFLFANVISVLLVLKQRMYGNLVKITV